MRKLREEQWARGLRPWYEKIGVAVWAFAAKRPALYAFVAGAVVRVLKRMSAHDGGIRSLPIGAGWTASRDFPAPSGKTLASCIARNGLIVRAPQAHSERFCLLVRSDKALSSRCAR